MPRRSAPPPQRWVRGGRVVARADSGLSGLSPSCRSFTESITSIPVLENSAGSTSRELQRSSGTFSRSYPLPGPKGVLDSPQRGSQGRVVAQQHGGHVGVVYPIYPYPGVGPIVVVGSEEAVAVEPPGCHQHEDTERGVAEREALRRVLRVHTDHLVELFYVVIVDTAQFLHPPRVVGQVFEAVYRFEVEQSTKLVVPGHAELSAAEHIGRSEVLRYTIRPLEVLEAARVVVQGDRAGVSRAKRVEQVFHLYLVHHFHGLPLRHSGKLPLLQHLVARDGPEGVVVGDERVHPVDRHELLSEGVGHTEVVRSPTNDSADHFVVAYASHQPLDCLPCQSPPVRVQAAPRGGMIQEGGRPLDGVDLRQQRRVYEPGAVEQLVVGPAGVLGAQPVADRVVLAGKERMHHCQPDPEARLVGWMLFAVGVDRYQAVGADLQLAVLPRPELALGLLIVAVDLRAVPPVGVNVDVGWRRPFLLRCAGGIFLRAEDAHRSFWPLIVVL